jgi:hypothetical protein
MAFSEAYLMRCFDDAPRWASKKTNLGDWYVHLKSGIDVVSRKDMASVQFSDPDTIFIPDTDDLLELIDNQIQAWESDPKQKTLRIEHDGHQGWSVTVEWGGRIAEATNGESIHMALSNALCQMALIDLAAKSKGFDVHNTGDALAP